MKRVALILNVFLLAAPLHAGQLGYWQLQNTELVIESDWPTIDNAWYNQAVVQDGDTWYMYVQGAPDPGCDLYYDTLHVWKSTGGAAGPWTYHNLLTPCIPVVPGIEGAATSQDRHVFGIGSVWADFFADGSDLLTINYAKASDSKQGEFYYAKVEDGDLVPGESWHRFLNIKNSLNPQGVTIFDPVLVEAGSNGQAFSLFFQFQDPRLSNLQYRLGFGYHDPAGGIQGVTKIETKNYGFLTANLATYEIPNDTLFLDVDRTAPDGITPQRYEWRYNPNQALLSLASNDGYLGYSRGSLHNKNYEFRFRIFHIDAQTKRWNGFANDWYSYKPNPYAVEGLCKPGDAPFLPYWVGSTVFYGADYHCRSNLHNGNYQGVSVMRATLPPLP